MTKSTIKASRVSALLAYDSGPKTPPSVRRKVKQLSLNHKGKALGQKLLVDALRFMRRLTTAVSQNKTINSELMKLGFQLVLEIVKGLVSKWLR